MTHSYTELSIFSIIN